MRTLVSAAGMYALLTLSLGGFLLIWAAFFPDSESPGSSSISIFGSKLPLASLMFPLAFPGVHVGAWVRERGGGLEHLAGLAVLLSALCFAIYGASYFFLSSAFMAALFLGLSYYAQSVRESNKAKQAGTR
ncbi:MAG: hypothetical protein P1U64_13140 [Alcanivoracaceae bacterium]|nr:hypothetical protein [Alcanivoracaceae bacterium]